MSGAGGSGVGGRGGSGAGGSAAGGSGAGGSGQGGNGGCMMELLGNGTFDSGNLGWTATSSVNTQMIYAAGSTALAGVPPASPSYAAVLGRNVANGQETLSQPITVPPGANTITIQGFFQIPLSPPPVCVACNSGVIEIVHNPDVINVKGWTNADGNGAWAAFGTTIDATPLRGLTVLFQMRTTATANTVLPFYFDSLSAKIDRCGP